MQSIMKTAVIAPVGMSPPAVSSFIDGIGEPISDVVLLVTRDRDVLAGTRFLDAGLSLRYPWLRIHPVILPFDDVATQDDTLRFMSEATRAFREERDTHQCDTIYLNITGGRKNMSVVLTLLGQILGADGVFSVVNPDIRYMNELLERYRGEINRFADIESREEGFALYEEHREEFDRILFPPRTGYEIIRIPTLPFPADHIGYLIRACLGSGERLAPQDEALLIRHGVLEKKTGGGSVLTPYGEKFLSILLGRQTDRG
ncbi:CRISPR-associated protein Csx14 [Methanocalculus chunghsingensis]|uniref:CRISPR-associated protein Csx14 n=1 Tax=Methanocalculus chunghsingensis TaxID=156457 RepID=UPI001B8DA015|nr:CRISPR-associated protein Csx14 [Methanocalculus chunghsingensis]